DADARRQLLSPLGPRTVATQPEAFKMDLACRRSTLLQKATAVDFQTYLAEDLLVKVDRASMLCSLEVRAPWLDPRLIDLAFRTLPDGLRATETERKILPRRLAARLLPASLD